MSVIFEMFNKKDKKSLIPKSHKGCIAGIIEARSYMGKKELDKAIDTAVKECREMNYKIKPGHAAKMRRWLQDDRERPDEPLLPVSYSPYSVKVYFRDGRDPVWDVETYDKWDDDKYFDWYSIKD